MGEHIEQPSGKDVLDVPIEDNASDAATIGDYLVSLLTQLWYQGEQFSGKRPLGNSGWRYELYAALGHAGMIDTRLDEDGFLEECDEATGDQLIASAIQALRQ